MAMAPIAPIPVHVHVTITATTSTPSRDLDAAILVPQPDRAALIREYLEAIDPTALEGEALARNDLTGNVTAAILAVLWDHAGDQDET